ncbi:MULTISPECIES: LysR substrate-binding domain-containing protein [unclassified Chelatococcus]|uniref:LysR family transcriptional regulator n=1 Tax=unclassified Chelatococcus TaxID=2638111 RepID=UPI001BCABAD4|nr:MULTISPECIES: LysR substrate-binding domain-containing protein [unclassified Chelatococcus]CAH1648140.1 LysR family transcriptional regulator [Hyphomicrobiales bacterium]MBS7742057.1 LysR family transcriptional regulator [Chelatococcus sp. HY11]MBX3541145.1 LysR family transcriptional regulator [Chelatococcus sp.]MCO5074960.1 LysR family transcriptional regulator [Chelatococcus sp.]CAH1690418.1 LysR family transcriptional regulator [Hyphomicrobiales bacterium]
MDLRQLEYFLRVAQRCNISLAAVELNITQPTLTKSIKLLEDELGVKLFERLPRGVALTDVGLRLLRHAEAVHVQVRDASQEIASLRSGTFGTVTIGAGPAWLRRNLPLAVAEVMKQHPGIQLRVEGGFDEALFRALRDGELDFVVAELPSPEDRRDVEVTPLTSDNLGVVCRAGHPLARRRRLSMRDVLTYPWVMPPRTTRAHRRFDALFVAHDLPPPTSCLETGSLAFLINVLLHSDALTFTVSKTLVTREGKDLVMLDAPDLTVRREAGIVIRRGGWLSPAAQHVADALKAICAAEPEN